MSKPSCLYHFRFKFSYVGIYLIQNFLACLLLKKKKKKLYKEEEIIATPKVSIALSVTSLKSNTSSMTGVEISSNTISNSIANFNLIKFVQKIREYNRNFSAIIRINNSSAKTSKF